MNHRKPWLAIAAVSGWLAGASGALAQDLEPVEEPEFTIPISADIEIRRSEDKITAHVGVTIEPNGDGSIYDIGEWGEPRRVDEVIYLDAKAIGPLESFNTEPVHLRHEYCLFSRDDGGGGGDGVGPIDFKPLELVPEFLRPQKREEVVWRTLEDWQAWVDAHWPEGQLGIGPLVPVDFETHTVVGVFLGRVIEGAGVEMHEIVSDGDVIDVRYAEWTPGILPDAGPLEYHRPGVMVAIPKTDLPVLFNGRPAEGGDLGGGGGQEVSSVEFERLEMVPDYTVPRKPQDIVIQSDQEWFDWLFEWMPQDIGAPLPPVDFDTHTVIGTFLGRVPLGLGIEITSVENHGKNLVVNVLETLPGVAPEPDLFDSPGVLVAIPKTTFPVEFRHDVLAFPSPPPIDPLPDPIPGGPSKEDPAPGEPAPNGPNVEGGPGFEVPGLEIPELPIAGQELGGDWPPMGAYVVVFRVNGHDIARTKLDLSGGGGGGGGDVKRIPADAGIEIEVSEDQQTAIAHVEVAFTGAPYHSIADWGDVTRTGNHFILSSKSTEIVFVAEPELPYFERHRYALPLGLAKPDPEPDPDYGEGVDFRRLKNPPQLEKPRNVVIQSQDEFWDLIGFEPGPLVLPPPNPVDFEEETLVAVFRGAKPNGCYGVSVTDVVTTEDGVVLVSYRLRDPRPNEFCTQAIVFPADWIALPKTDQPIDFIELPDLGMDPIPVEPGGGIGDGAGAPPAAEDDLGGIPVEADGGIGDGAGPPPFGEVDAGEVGGFYTVEFRIDGIVYADAEFVVGDHGGEPDPKIPAKADIDIEANADGVMAHVEVAFTGAPYHSITDWGGVQREGNHFILDSEANEIVFVREPDLPYFERHAYALPVRGGGGDPGKPAPGPDPDDGVPVEFRAVEPVGWPLIDQQQNVIIQSQEEFWELIGFDPAQGEEPPADPIDYEEETLIGVFRGQQPNGCHDVSLLSVVVDDAGVVLVHYQLRDERPGEACTEALVYPMALVAIAKQDLPIDFIEWPDPGAGVIVDGKPIPVEGDGGIGDGGEPVPDVVDFEELYTVEFRINGVAYAHARFVLGGDSGGGGGPDPKPDPDPDPKPDPDPDPDPELPVRAEIELSQVEGAASLNAAVTVAFTGQPYLTVADWGDVVHRADGYYVLDARSGELQFVVEPELPYFEEHTYEVPLPNETPPAPDPIEGEPLDFERVKTPLQLEERYVGVVQTVDDWWDLIGVEPGPAVDPIRPPIDLNVHTLIAVFLGERPDTCYDVRIQEVIRRNDGVIEVIYQLREPRPDEGCGDALTYPASLVAITKTDLPVEFVELPDDGSDFHAPMPVDARGGITVEFRLDGQGLARAYYAMNDLPTEPETDPDPDGTPDPDVGDGTTGGDGGNGGTELPPGLPDGFADWLGRFLGAPPTLADFGGGDDGEEGDQVARGFAKMNRDGDRWSDFHEFLLNGDPLDHSRGPQLRPEWIHDEAGTHFALCIERRKGAEEHAEFILEVSQNLHEWIHDPALVGQVDVKELDEENEEVIFGFRDTFATSLYPYIRLRLRDKVEEQ